MIGEGIELHIKGIRVDWDKVEEDSYLRDIDSIAGIEQQWTRMSCMLRQPDNTGNKAELSRFASRKFDGPTPLILVYYHPQTCLKSDDSVLFSTSVCRAERVVQGIRV